LFAPYPVLSVLADSNAAASEMGDEGNKNWPLSCPPRGALIANWGVGSE